MVFFMMGYKIIVSIQLVSIQLKKLYSKIIVNWVLFNILNNINMNIEIYYRCKINSFHYLPISIKIHFIFTLALFFIIPSIC